MARRNFKATWGISCNDIAEAENVTPEAIRMRVRNFGTPWQRRRKETKFEAKYGKTLAQIALELDLHPQTIARREEQYNNAYHKPMNHNGIGGSILNEQGYHWTVNPKMYNIREASTFMEEYDENKKV